MRSDVERQLMRRIHGELSAAEAAELERRIAGDPELEALERRYRALWAELELPPPAALPADFAAGVAAEARRRAGELRLATAPGWVRAGAAAALVGGMLLGALLGGGFAVSEPVAEQETAYYDAPLSLAESYWLTLEESSGDLDGDALDGDAGGELPR